MYIFTVTIHNAGFSNLFLGKIFLVHTEMNNKDALGDLCLFSFLIEKT